MYVYQHIAMYLYTYLGATFSVFIHIHVIIILRIFSHFFLSKRWPCFKLCKALSPVELADRSWKQTIVFCCLATTYCEWKTKQWQLLPHPDTHTVTPALQPSKWDRSTKFHLRKVKLFLWGWGGMFLKRTFKNFILIRIILLL